MLVKMFGIQSLKQISLQLLTQWTGLLVELVSLLDNLQTSSLASRKFWKLYFNSCSL